MTADNNPNRTTHSTSRRNFMRSSSVAAALGVGLLAGSDTVSAASNRYSYTIMSGTERETEVHVYDSGRSGPTTLVVGGIHGNEPSGYEAASRIKDWAVESGKLVVLPRANQTAIRQDVRPWNPDLNREFPPNSACHSDLAQAIWDEVVLEHDPDWAFDLHSARGIYKSGDGSVGQALFPTSASPAHNYGEKTIAGLNDEFGLSGEMQYLMGNTLDGSRDMLMHRISARLDAPGFICETTRKADSLDEQIQWHLYTVGTVLEQVGQGVNKDGSPAGETREMAVVGTGNETEYRLTTSDFLQVKSSENGASVSDTTAQSTVKWTSDVYYFRGSVESLDVLSGDENVDVWVDGEKYAPGDFASDSSSSSNASGERKMAVVGTGNETEYDLSVSGGIEVDQSEGETTVADDTAFGRVKWKSDTFTFTGDVESFNVLAGDENVDIWIDGSKYAPDDFPSRSVHKMAVVGTGNVTNYELRITGGLRADKTEGLCDVSGNSAHGRVKWKSDTFTFTGDVESLTVLAGDENVDVWIDGSKYAPDDFSSEKREIAIVGTGSETTYDLTVSGNISARQDTVESGDETFDGAAAGSVKWKSDNYYFTGEVESLVLPQGGDVDVWIDGSKYAPSDF